jgi:hypothetical protein
MKRVHFHHDFDVTPREDNPAKITHAFYAGNLHELPDDWADGAVLSGAAVFVDGDVLPDYASAPAGEAPTASEGQD